MANWLNVNPMSGMAGETTTVRLTPVNANTGRVKRTGNLKVKVGDRVLKTIPVVQNEKELNITLDNKNYSVIDAGGQISIEFATNAYGISLDWDGYVADENVPPYIQITASSTFPFRNQITGLYFEINMSAISAYKDYVINWYAEIFNITNETARTLLDNYILKTFFLCDDLTAISVASFINEKRPSNLSSNACLMTIYGTDTATMLPQGVNASVEVISPLNGKYSEYTVVLPNIMIPNALGEQSSIIELFGRGESGATVTETINITHLVPSITTDKEDITVLDNESDNVITITSDSDWTLDISEQTQISE